jgi:hypothetical protein
MAPETLVKHRDLRGHPDAHRCCGKSLMENALVGFDVRQHAPAESIPSVLLQPLGHLSALESILAGATQAKDPRVSHL